MSSDLHESIYDEIQSRITSLGSGAPAAGSSGDAWTTDEIQAEIATLTADKEQLLSHWSPSSRLVVADERVRAKACGNEQPCPHVLELAQKYGLI